MMTEFSHRFADYPKGLRRRTSICTAVAVGMALVLTACGAAAPTPMSPAASPTGTPAQAGGAAAGTKLNVFAAASLQEAFTEIGKGFEAGHPGTQVVFNFAGSQQLAQQISQQAPADVFASANKAQMTVAIQSGRIVSGTDRVFARNRLVVVLPKDNPGRIQTLQDLARPGLKVILAAKEVPVGQYALDFLTRTVKDASFGPGFQAAVLQNVVSYEDSVRSVLSKVVLGEADAGIVYTTDVTPDAAPKVVRIDIPDALNTVATYPLAAIQDSPQAGLASQFVDYVLSDAGQKVLASHGFITVQGQ
jgi:molybdate transport system substrate-binding protein